MAVVIAGLPLPARAWGNAPAIDFGAGATSMSHIAVHAVLGINYDEICVAGKGRWSSEFNLFGEKQPPETISEFGFLAGPYWNHSFAYASIGGGLSALRFEERTSIGRPNADCESMFCADSVFETRKTWTVGIPVEAMFTLKLWIIGGGFRAYANTNLHNSYVGLSTIIFLGGGGTRSRPAKGRPEGD